MLNTILRRVRVLLCRIQLFLFEFPVAQTRAAFVAAGSFCCCCCPRGQLPFGVAAVVGSAATHSLVAASTGNAKHFPVTQFGDSYGAFAPLPQPQFSCCCCHHCVRSQKVSSSHLNLSVVVCQPFCGQHNNSNALNWGQLNFYAWHEATFAPCQKLMLAITTTTGTACCQTSWSLSILGFTTCSSCMQNAINWLLIDNAEQKIQALQMVKGLPFPTDCLPVYQQSTLSAFNKHIKFITLPII